MAEKRKMDLERFTVVYRDVVIEYKDVNTPFNVDRKLSLQRILFETVFTSFNGSSSSFDHLKPSWILMLNFELHNRLT